MNEQGRGCCREKKCYDHPLGRAAAAESGVLCSLQFKNMQYALCTINLALYTTHYAVHFALCTVRYASIRLGVLPQSREPAHKLQPPLIPPALDPDLVSHTFLKVNQSEEEIWSN